ncbi:30S ribosomal protein S2 [Halohasta salina]|uniref:30S ribosomal protein S2 n=1 Tax=Halohasta salina TaxID=2961621 RepID=UPI0020A3C536|nr:30S ribosomal protein S2 [Halohasta salina]
MSDNDTEIEQQAQDAADEADEADVDDEPVAEEPAADEAPDEDAAEAEPTADDADAVDEEAAPEADEAEEDASPFDDDVMPDEEVDLLIPVEDYLGAGVHIGTQQKTQDMERFIHRVRDDGLYVLDVSQTDSRIRTAADFLAGYDPEQVLVTSSRQYGRFPAEKFADAIGARARTGRFIPGTLTNPDYAGYIEPDVVVVTDPIGDAQAVKEAITVGIPVIAMCDSNNQVSNVDLVIPTNNKGRRALSVVYWLLANETLDRRNAGTVYALDDFEDEL